MLYISISILLFTLMGGMLLLAKTKKESLGGFFSGISYFVIVFSISLIICQTTVGIMRMTGHDRYNRPMECCMPGMIGCRMQPGGMMYKSWGSAHDRFNEEIECCKEEKTDCCMDYEGDDDTPTNPDSTKKP